MPSLRTSLVGEPIQSGPSARWSATVGEHGSHGANSEPPAQLLTPSLNPERHGEVSDERRFSRRVVDPHPRAEDADSHTLLYANADLFKATQNNEVLAFADHWQTVTGHDPKLLIMDSKVTTQRQFGELTDRGITFITLRPAPPNSPPHYTPSRPAPGPR